GPPRARRLRSRRLSANFPLVPVENPGRALIAALTVSLTVTVAAPSARAEIFGNTYRSADFGVEITVPRGFELSEQRAYPGLLARAFEHTTSARLSLVAQRVLADETARAYADRNVRSLRKLGYKVNGTTTGASGATIVDAVSPDGKHAIRQAYVVQDPLAY